MRAQADESRADLEQKLAALEGENAALRARQSATSRVLQAIAGGPTGGARALDIIAESASVLCGAYDAVVLLRDHNNLARGGHYGPIPMDIERFPISPGWTAGRCVLERRAIHVHDLLTAGDEFPEGAEMARRLGHRTIVSVPLSRGEEAIGSITLRRLETSPFSEEDIALLSTFADQAVIAIENIRLLNELREALQQQTAMGDVLKAISRSTFDLPTVLTTLVEAAVRLCDADQGTIAREKKGVFVRVASHGFSSEFMAAVLDKPIELDRASASGRALVEGRIVRIPDVRSDPEYRYPDALQYGGFRSLIGVPMLRDGAPIGVLALTRKDVRPFTDEEIELVATFADQAAIAIENARLFETVQGRTRELEEALAHQMATTQILQVIGRSPSDARPVFDAIVEAGRKLFPAAAVSIALPEGDAVVAAAVADSDPERTAAWRGVFPFPLEREYMHARVILDGTVVDIPDAADAPSDLAAGARNFLRSGYRAATIVPIFRADRPIGALSVVRVAPGPLSSKEHDLLSTFAGQAVIAIENARLFEAVQARTKELEESLAHQTATSEILRAISTTMTDTQPVFEAIVRNAVSLCGGLFANVFRYDGELLDFVASSNVEPGYVDLLREKYPMRPDPSQVSGRVIIARAPVWVADALADPDYDQRFPSAMRWRRMLGVPMLRDGVPLGVIVVGWADAGPVPKRQEELLRTFADQAVIAIENARLLTELGSKNHELNETLEQQVATSAILRVIASSPTDLTPVLSAVAENAARLCGADDAQIFRFQGDMLHLEASFGSIPIHFREQRVGRDWVTGRSVVDRRTIHVHDLAAEPEGEFPVGRKMQREHGHHTTLTTPMLKQGMVLGAILIRRMEVHPFSDEQIRLLETFADQSAIAIENARLFEALEAALAEFNAVLDSIDYGVLFMDKELRTRIVNPALRRLWDIPESLVEQRPTIQELFEYNRDRGIYTTPPDRWDEWVAARIRRIREGNIPPGEFIRADGKVYSYQCVALPDGGRMLSYFDITELKRRQAELLSAKEAAETALAELRTAQERLVQSEKLASLGQLTAGIAHEIKNPLNFVNNFASLSRDLLVELQAVLQAPIAAVAAADRDDAEDLFRTVRENLEKIVHHGKRADSIVRNMLLHARQGSGEWRSADINAIAEEALNLAYHGARAGHPDFNVEIGKHFDPEAGAVECCPQDVMRVILNLVSNGIYAANKKRPSSPAGFVPRIDLTTRAEDAGIAVEVRDNGTGIPAEIRESIFLPFFTTKPAGEGTGLGLSLSHDIVVKQHGGSFSVESEPGAFTSFRVVLPRHAVTDRRIEA